MKVGDRVYYVQHYVGRGKVIDNDVTGTITSIDANGFYVVTWDDSDEPITYYPEHLTSAG